jgi:hypothetical protein
MKSRKLIILFLNILIAGPQASKLMLFKDSELLPRFTQKPNTPPPMDQEPKHERSIFDSVAGEASKEFKVPPKS